MLSGWAKLCVRGLLGGTLLVGGGAMAQSDVKTNEASSERPNIPGIEKRLGGKKGRASKGIDVVLSREKGNCLTCHEFPLADRDKFQGTVGPALKGVATRYTEAQLRQLIVDARVFYPTTTMPPYHASAALYRVAGPFDGKNILNEQEIEDVVAYLKTLR